jgi:hypothetical protein
MKWSRDLEDEPEALNLNLGLRRADASKIARLTQVLHLNNLIIRGPLYHYYLSKYNSLIPQAYKHPLQLILRPEVELQKS